MDTTKDDPKHIGVEEQQIEVVPEKGQGEGFDTGATVQILETQRRSLAERQLVRKLDMRLLPTIFLIYIVNYIDVSHAVLMS